MSGNSYRLEFTLRKMHTGQAGSALPFHFLLDDAYLLAYLPTFEHE